MQITLGRPGFVFCSLLLVSAVFSTAPARAGTLSATPPMGWNDWAHYQCQYTAQTVLDNAKALVSTGLAAAGYDRVTVDDCWMGKKRDAAGALQPNLKRFPHGVAPVIAAVHAMGLKFGIYEDAGSKTCGGFAGSGAARPGGKTHFVQDMRQFAKWGVDYVKLDGCNVQIPEGVSAVHAYRAAYAAASAAIKATGTPMIFLESAPAYFQGKPTWYDVLDWVAQYGQLWREGSDIRTYNRAHPAAPRFRSVLWNYSYNLPLGRYQTPGHWNDPDFIIGGDGGMSLAETRSQMALWAMMSAPLVLSVDVSKLSSSALQVLGDKRVIRVDQDPLGRMATLVRRTPARDVLLKRLSHGGYAVAVLNHSFAAINVSLSTADLGFSNPSACTLSVRNLWSGNVATGQRTIDGTVKPGDTTIWRIDPSAACGKVKRSGAIVMTVPGSRSVEGYGRCLTATRYRGTSAVLPCDGTKRQAWVIGANHTLRVQGKCLGEINDAAHMTGCSGDKSQNWIYKRNGNLVNAKDKLCLTARQTSHMWMPMDLRQCGHNEATQVWSLPDD